MCIINNKQTDCKCNYIEEIILDKKNAMKEICDKNRLTELYDFLTLAYSIVNKPKTSELSVLAKTFLIEQDKDNQFEKPQKKKKPQEQPLINVNREDIKKAFTTKYTHFITPTTKKDVLATLKSLIDDFEKNNLPISEEIRALIDNTKKFNIDDLKSFVTTLREPNKKKCAKGNEELKKAFLNSYDSYVTTKTDVVDLLKELIKDVEILVYNNLVSNSEFLNLLPQEYAIDSEPPKSDDEPSVKSETKRLSRRLSIFGREKSIRQKETESSNSTSSSPPTN